VTGQDLLVALGDMRKSAERAIECVCELRAAVESQLSNAERLRRLRESGVLLQLDLWFARARLLARAGILDPLGPDAGLYAACSALEAFGPFPDREESDHG
jgi:hypothetical protein